MFQLTNTEWSKLRSQIATLNKDTRKYKPYVFTEHGILMLSSVLNSDKAIGQIIITLNNLIDKPPKTRRIGFNAGD